MVELPRQRIFGVAELRQNADAYVRDLESKPREHEKESNAIKAGKTCEKQGCLGFDDFMAIAIWKSPRPKKWYESNSDLTVQEISKRSFAAKSDLERLLWLTELEGVKTRVASAILHLGHSTPYPVLDVWTIAAFGVGREKTAEWDEFRWLRIWPDYIKRCRELYEKTSLPVRTVDRALWWIGQYGKK